MVQNSPDSGSSARTLGYAGLRVAIGMSLLIHGIVRIPKVSAFTAVTVKMFADSPLPKFAVAGFARATPFVELVLGILLLLGLATCFACVAGALWMVALIFGSTLIEKYDIVGIQLIYSIIFFQLLLHLPDNQLSVDFLMNKPARR